MGIHITSALFKGCLHPALSSVYMLRRYHGSMTSSLYSQIVQTNNHENITIPRCWPFVKAVPHKGPVMGKVCTCHGIIAKPGPSVLIHSNTENITIPHYWSFVKGTPPQRLSNGHSDDYVDISTHFLIICVCVCVLDQYHNEINTKRFDILTIHRLNCKFITLQKQGATAVYTHTYIYIYIHVYTNQLQPYQNPDRKHLLDNLDYTPISFGTLLIIIDPGTVECRYNAVRFSTILHTSRWCQNII